MGGGQIDIVRADTDYYRTFMHETTKGKHIGKRCGFPLGGKCRINSDCKIAPIHRYYAQFADYDITQYVGIAYDEEKRLVKMHKSANKVSLMEKYKVTEAMAKEMCKEQGLLSPIYDTGTRGGCWFCPNMRKRQACEFRKAHPDLWKELLMLGKTDNLVSYGFKYGMTIEQWNSVLDGMDNQLKLF